MDMTGERRIPAPRAKVWDALNDPDVLKASIPGCQSLEKLSATEMKATAAVKIGPISARFSGNVQLSDLDPPTGYRISGEGQGGVAGFAKGGAMVHLDEDGDDTLLKYEVHAQVGGKIAQLGARLIDSTAKNLADQFFRNFSHQVAPPAGGGRGSARGAGVPRRAARRGRYRRTSTRRRFSPPRPAPKWRNRCCRQRIRGRRLACWTWCRANRSASRWPPGLAVRCSWRSCCCSWEHLLVVALPASVSDTARLLADQGYIADRELATTVHLALSMRRPLFLEGEPGTGKTEIAKVLAAGLGRRLVRLQCYDGMDLSAAAYEWDHARQLMAIRLAEAAGHTDRDELSRDIYTREYLLARPLLAAIDPDLPPAVLLIDELDRADEPFEAFLLEVLADFQISVPEFGTVRAKAQPVVVLTSNRTREVHDAIRRRCLYHWVDYPDAARERAILAAKAPDVPERLSAQVVASCSGCAARTCSSCPAWRRPSNGRRR